LSEFTDATLAKGDAIDMTNCAYRIIIDGELDDLSAAAFADLDVERGRGATVLRTEPIDQAALNGVLDRLRLIGAALVEVRRAGNVGGAAAPVSPSGH
jgi:hypothetical protein